MTQSVIATRQASQAQPVVLPASQSVDQWLVRLRACVSDLGWTSEGPVGA